MICPPGFSRVASTSRLALAVLMGLAPLSTARAADYYVDQASVGGPCSDANAGTSQDAPWCTLGKANTELQPGDTAFLRQGVYDEVLEPYQSGLPDAPIRYARFENEDVTIRGEPGQFLVVAIGWEVHGQGWAKSYIIVEGLTIRHIDPASVSGEEVIAVLLNGPDSHHNEIRDCRVQCQGAPSWQGSVDNGIVISTSTDNLVAGNHIEGWCHSAIALGSAARRNTIRGNTVVNAYGNGINFDSSQGEMRGTLIEANALCGSVFSDGIQFEPRYDLPPGQIDFDSNQGVVIRNNVIRNNGENGLDLKGAAHMLVEGNVFYGNTGNDNGGLDPAQGNNRDGGLGGIMHGTGTGSRDVIIRRNVFYDNEGAVLPENGYKIYNNVVAYNNRDYTGPNSSHPSGPFIGIAACSGTAGVVIKNNAIGGHHRADMLICNDAANLVIDHNLYFGSGGPKLALRDPVQETWTEYALEEWTALLEGLEGVAGADAHSAVADPLFVDVPADPVGPPEAFDFHLTADSPAIDAGGHLTRAVGSGSGTAIPVEDAGFFCDGYGITAGDLVQLEGGSELVRITAVDHGSNVITVDQAVSWQSGQGISLPYRGAAPDVGAHEYGGEAPAVDLTADPTQGAAPLVVSFDAHSSDAEGEPLTHDWDLDGDGTFETETGAEPTASSTYESDGTYLVQVRVSDGAHAVTDAVTITVGSSLVDDAIDTDGCDCRAGNRPWRRRELVLLIALAGLCLGRRRCGSASLPESTATR